MSTQSTPELLLGKHLRELGLKFEREVKFHPIRLWRWDFVLTEHRIAIEIDGGLWMGRKGGHTGGHGKQRDLDKQNAGVMLGYRVLRFSSRDVLQGRARDFLKLHLLEQAP